MELRKSTLKDIDRIMDIIKQSQNYFKENNIDQWQNNYPNEEIIKEDISNGESYVLLNNNKIVGTTVISFNRERTYDKIYEGKWLTNDKYANIHRIALDNEYKGQGLSGEILKYVEDCCKERGIHSIKGDTHEDNLSMQKFFEKNGFKYCGVIYLEDGDKRVAFEKTL